VHPLDNPVWHALTGAQTTVGDDRNGPLARRYDADVAPFAALPDAVAPDSWDALRDLVGPDGVAVLARDTIAEIDGWQCLERIDGFQMLPGRPLHGPDVDLVTLGVDDVPAMLDLVARTEPGPFAERTIELGTYLGVRSDDGRLVAMAGERMRPPGHGEISAVCVDPAFRRRGFAAALMRALIDTIEERGEQPFLHVAADNDSGIRTYEALGFTVRTEIEFAVLQAPR